MLAREIEDALRPVSSLTERVVTTLPRAMPPSEHDESELGTRMADAMLQAARPFGATLAIAEGDFRAGLPAGVVTYGDVYAAWPFGVDVVVVELTGAELTGVVGRWLTSNDPPPQVAGFSVEYTRKDGASHATSKLESITVSGKPLARIRSTRSRSTNTSRVSPAIRPSSRHAREAAARTRRSSRERPSPTSSGGRLRRTARSRGCSGADLSSWSRDRRGPGTTRSRRVDRVGPVGDHGGVRDCRASASTRSGPRGSLEKPASEWMRAARQVDDPTVAARERRSWGRPRGGRPRRRRAAEIRLEHEVVCGASGCQSATQTKETKL